MADKSFRGVIQIIPLPFDSEGELDIEDLKRTVSFCLVSGAHGLGTGYGSEFYALSDEERKKLTNALVEEANGKAPVIVATAHPGLKVAVQLSKDAEDTGADGLLITPPYVTPADPDLLQVYYRRLAESVEIPIMIQDFGLSTSFIVKLAEEYSNVRYAKVETANSLAKISELLELSKGKLTVFGGKGGHALIEEFERGAKGVMPGSCIVDWFVRAYDNLESGDKKKACGIFYSKVLPLLNYELHEGFFLPVEKEVLLIRGIIKSSNLRIHSSLDMKCRQELRRILEFTGVVST